ncbi:glycerol dehydrogenase [Aquabacter sp. CN5-332]|uniref:glycerol dehydrogenase n=1 Tax=Aquabacter sp. CN5-332 TaxID=3156608 RepID=UPI0032B32559
MMIFGSPRRYIQGPDARLKLGEELARLGRTAVLLTDTFVGDLIGDDAEKSCAAAGIALERVTFGGEITRAEIDRLEALCRQKQPDIVIAAGGGKTIDTGKSLGSRLNARIVTIPTVASNDSPTSHIIVVYDENHKLVGVDKLNGNPDLVLVDTAIIAKAPPILLSAGIGDALVKRFEVEQCVNVSGTNMFGGRPPRAALALARACYDTIREFSVAALQAVKRGESDEALERVVEASVLMSGLAFESGGLSISHAMTRGLSAVKGPASALHGLQVAYGLLVQLQLENRPADFMAEMRAFYRATGLPVRLADLGFSGGDEDLALIADLTAQAPHMKHFERPLSAADLRAAIEVVEAMGNHDANESARLSA